ncbi:hypothetical protein HHK36_026533 [Tetracentron sinense]|uniref:Photolyase/cryptochrome alpha/beta domain-containing protein n=1 Tax=Tetracentron sinense TaxID=13715 RepID=A0A835D2Q8_TETSI|nr:hypothetical protein HHK36_026533 [Tetracentron sinense]
MESEDKLFLVRQRQSEAKIIRWKGALSAELWLRMATGHVNRGWDRVGSIPVQTRPVAIPSYGNRVLVLKHDFAHELLELGLSSFTKARALLFSKQATLRGWSRLFFFFADLPGVRVAAIVWFRNDLRVHDNECLNSANNESISVLPVYCFDPRDYGKSSSGFDKTGPYRATFLIESVSDLRRNLQARGSDLVVRIGKPEIVLAELVKTVGADAIYAHREVSHDEVRAEDKIETAMKEESVEVKYFWGSTLYHVDDLPFNLEEMPSNYSGFREKMNGLEVRKTIAALDQLRGLPSRGDVEPGEIPTLLDLGLNPATTMVQDGKPAANASLVGGETEAQQRLRKFAAECQAQPNKGHKDGSHDSIYGANFSCKISPWLAMGCLSPRFMFDELNNSATRMISAASTRKDGGSGPSDTGMNWLMFELLWRDFFRFITKKYSSTKKQLEAAPATACTGALA